MQSLEASIRFPIPEDLIEYPEDQFLFYYPLTYGEDTKVLFESIAEEQKWPMAPLPPNFVVATALHLWRPYIRT
jgi:hypothetical protein